MDWLQIIILAIVQGITEFLPVSSSAHLILPSALGDWPDQGLAFDVAVHLGSLLAVVWYFRSDLENYLSAAHRFALQRKSDAATDEMLKLGAATVPVVLAGLALKDWVAAELRTIEVIAATSILFGLLLAFADRKHGARTDVGWRDALIIGGFQTLAIIPGTSRSGITITAALLLGLSRTSAARFAFLLSIPTIAGAALLTGLDLRSQPEPVNWGELVTGAALACASAYLCIASFIALVERTGMMPYVIYRLALGVILFWIAGTT